MQLKGLDVNTFSMKTTSPQVAGLNGTGRFGLHLIQYWTKNYKNSKFDIRYLNDEELTFEQFEDIVRTDPYLKLSENITFSRPYILIRIDGSEIHRLLYTNSKLESLPWQDKIDIFLECSGRYSDNLNWYKENLYDKPVVISSTSWEADKIIIYGYNQNKLKGEKAISYGSCTVNAYVPLAASINRHWGVMDSDVNIIHNVPEYKLDKLKGIQKSNCTLEKVAPLLLDFIKFDNFTVNYSLVPYSGVSAIDFRFKLSKKTSKEDVFNVLTKETLKGSLTGLYSVEEKDTGANIHKFSPYSAVIIKSTSRVIGDNLYLCAYFDNENSANRFFDLTNYLIKEK